MTILSKINKRKGQAVTKRGNYGDRMIIEKKKCDTQDRMLCAYLFWRR